jgi:mevalonate pyrophosphate decarboxylase
MDAGPHVKVLTTAADAAAVASALRGVAGVTEVSVAAAGGAAAIIRNESRPPHEGRPT